MMKQRLLSTLLALCMALALLPATAQAAISVTVTPTDIHADTVANSDGYGCLKIAGNWGNYYPGDILTGDADGIVNPQIALVDRNGKLLFPYRENADPYLRDVYYHCSDGIVSLSYGSTYVDEGYPEYYRLDGSKAFTLDESLNHVGSAMHNGYAVIVDFPIGTYGHPIARRIVDKNGKVTCELPEEYSEAAIGWGMINFESHLKLSDRCGEGWFAYFELVFPENRGYTFTGNGYIDVAGKEVLNLEGRGFTDLGAFSSGLAWVVYNDEKCGYIDKTGKLVIPLLYDVVNEFSDAGLASVKKDGKWGYIDKTGATVIPFEYDGAYGADAGLAAVVKNGKCGLVDYSNNVVLPLEYDDISSCADGVAYAVKDGLLYIITWDAPGSGTTPAEPEQTPAPATKPTVILTNQNLTVDGEAKATEIYNIDGSNYFKLRDMAALLNGTGSQFSVDYDAARSTIVVKKGEAYTVAGGELETGTDKSASAVASAQSIEIDGEKVDLTAYNIGGNNFFKLRELGTALGFDVDYDSGTATMIVKSK